MSAFKEAENKKKGDDTELTLPLHACYVQIADMFQDLFRYTRMDSISCFYPTEDGTAIMLFDGKVSNDSGGYEYALGLDGIVAPCCIKTDIF